VNVSNDNTDEILKFIHECQIGFDEIIAKIIK